MVDIGRLSSFLEIDFEIDKYFDVPIYIFE